MVFNIHDYTERLTPSKGKKYHCPVCQDPEFALDKDGGGGTSTEVAVTEKKSRMLSSHPVKRKNCLRPIEKRKGNAGLPIISPQHILKNLQPVPSQKIWRA